MTAETMPVTSPTDVSPEFWRRLTAPFAEAEIEKKPQPVKANDDNRGKCTRGSAYSVDGHYCGGYHAKSIHLDYVGHAGLTMRLNEVAGPDGWGWEPMALTEHGTPLLTDGGIWINLTIHGVSKIGFGDPGTSRGANGMKEMIGDALRNAGLRFGIATYLWGKSDKAKAMKMEEYAQEPEQNQQEPTQPVGHRRPPAPDPVPEPTNAPVHYRFAAWVGEMVPNWSTDATKDAVMGAFAVKGVDIASATSEDWQALWDDWKVNGVPIDRVQS